MRTTCFLLLLLALMPALAYPQALPLQGNWQFRQSGTGNWLSAQVPGTVHTDLLRHNKIPNPFFGSNEQSLQWISEADWEYRTRFRVPAALQRHPQLCMVFEGLDTYATIYLNGRVLLQTDNMYRMWRVPLAGRVATDNELRIVFRSARRLADSLAAVQQPPAIPDHPRVFVRKAPYQFGWDWAPHLTTCGIWKPVYLDTLLQIPEPAPAATKNRVELLQEPDSVGRSFLFRINGQDVYMKGANWVPADVFLPRLQPADYRRLVHMAKAANMNMLRVWGGGIYEHDAFYEACEREGIYVWQDLMFAGGMIPLEDSFFRNVKAELEYQVKRLRKYNCIVLWCGNNEVEEAWHNWGWQKQFNLHDADSAAVWQAYRRLFRDSIPVWLQQWDGTRPYLPSSPVHGWGRPESITEGDSHYWGLWWGLQDVEVFAHKTGRFVSEYGMQAMPTLPTVYSFTKPQDRYLFSAVLRQHQKHPTGFENLRHYLHRYFIDSARQAQLSLQQYTYLTQCLQHYVLHNSIAWHRSKYPVNRGTLLWQLNDCWPVASWSIVDYYGRRKAGYYAVKDAYRDAVLPRSDSLPPKAWNLQPPKIRLLQKNKEVLITAENDAAYVYVHKGGEELELEENFFYLKAGERRRLQPANRSWKKNEWKRLQVMSLYDVLHGK